MVDFRCRKCGRVWEEMRRGNAKWAWCCGVKAPKVYVAATPIHVTQSYFNRSMGKTITSARQFERELKNAGCHVATKQEIEESMHPRDYKPVVDPEPITIAAEKAWSALHAEGKI